ncbi:PREDICTED: arginase, hepatic-like isoform X2 [Priapulus caudatus]|uniref:Arginase n=1 Tax=Priapulus caudatus TaxID=37621 RepID=A0ABM1DZ51_PRICU|nr:PREDICTED: arginase, hepatic-like isoform X1 [Priapulus caudatus]XP_014665223.1 PREDICTED: arginase, hepatic-like isoform X2 [Priapulus caudatus]
MPSGGEHSSTVREGRAGQQIGRAAGPVRRGIGIVGVPIWHGQPNPGTQWAPKRLRETGVIGGLQRLGWHVNDYGDLQFITFQDDIAYEPNAIYNPRTVGDATRKIAAAVRRSLQDNGISLNIGGDHSMTIGTFHAHAQVFDKPCLVWVDAHADINTAASSVSGHIHGMPVAFMLHETSGLCNVLPGFEWCRPSLTAKDVVYIGLRDIDPPEWDIIDRLGITYFDMKSIDQLGIAAVIKKALDAVNPNRDRPIHLSFDVDGLDTLEAPSTGTPVPGGMKLSEAVYIGEQLHKTGMLTCLDLAEINPDIGSASDQKRTLYAARTIIEACFGKKTLDAALASENGVGLIDYHM